MFSNGIEALNFIREHQSHSHFKCMTQAVIDYAQTGQMEEAYDPIEVITCYSDLLRLSKQLPGEDREVLQAYINNGLDGYYGALALIKAKYPENATAEMQKVKFLMCLAGYEQLLREHEYITGNVVSIFSALNSLEVAA
ncbi:MAG: hypothetical protein AB7E96_06910 [Deferribacterales bacterium]